MILSAGLGTAVGFFLAVMLYLLPAVVATAREKRSAAAIFVANLFFGITGVGWVACLVWALVPDPVPQPMVRASVPQSSSTPE